MRNQAILFIFILAIFLFLSNASAQIVINSPSSNFEVMNTLSTVLNVTLSGGFNSSAIYSWTNGLTNYTLCTSCKSPNWSSITFPRQSYYNISIWAFNSTGSVQSNVSTNVFVGNESKFNDISDVAVNTPSFMFPPNPYAYLSFIKYNITSLPKVNINIKNAKFYFYIVGGSSLSSTTITGSTNQTWNESISSSEFNSLFINRVNSSDVSFSSNSTSTWTYFSDTKIISSVGFNNHTSVFINSSYFDSSDCAVSPDGQLWIGDYPDGSKIMNFEDREGSGGTTKYPYLNISYYSSNTAPIITNTLANNTNLSTSNVDFTFNISDDDDYVTNISLFLNGVLNTTSYQNYPITANTNNSLNFSKVLTDGQYNWSVQGCDSDSNCTNSQTFSLLVDTTPPSLNIVYPTDYETFTYNSNINVNYTVSDSGVGLSSCWWSNSSGLSNHTITCGNNITVSEAGSGSYAVTLWANDTLNNLNNKTIHYTISLDSPAVNLLNPTNNLWLNYKNNILFNFTSTDDNGISSAELWGNWTGSWAKNQTLTSVTSGLATNFDLINLTDGNYIWSVWSNDTTNQASWSVINYTLHIDTTFPQINLTYPLNISYTTIPTSLNYSRSDLNLFSCWYSNNNGLTNSTPDTNCNNFSLIANQGNNNWTVYINDSANNQNSSKVTFFVDSINPSVLINTSFTNGSYLNYNSSIIVNLTISDANLQSCWYNDNDETNISFTCGDNLSLSLSESLHKINLFSNDTLNNINNTESISFTPDVTFPLVNVTNVATTTGTNVITIYANATDLNINNCYFSIYNSSNGLDSLTPENTSIGCQEDKIWSVSTYGTYLIKLYGKDKAGNENSTNQSFTTAPTPPVIITTPGGGGGTSTPEVTIPVISLPMIQGTKTYSDLDRAIIYARINEFAYKRIHPLAISVIDDLSGQVQLTYNDLNIIYNNLISEQVTTTKEDLALFYKEYQNRNLVQGFETLITIQKYGLFTAVLGIVNQLTILPSSISHPLVVWTSRNNFTYEKVLLTNKKIKYCEVTLGSPNARCDLMGNNSVRVSYDITNLTFWSKTIKFKVSLTTDSLPETTEIREIPFSISVYNLGKSVLNGIPVWIFGIISVSSVVLISFIFKKSHVITKIKSWRKK